MREGGPNMDEIKVLIVDDHALMRQGLKKILEMEDNITVVGEASDGLDALKKVKELNPDVVLMDINMPEMSGIDTIKLFKKEGIKCGVIILTIYDEPEYLFEGLRAGAQGFILKDVDSTVLIDAVTAVNRGESFIQPNMTRELIYEFNRLSENKKKTNTSPLTKRESEVLKYITEGYSNSEIASKLMISEKTVKNHVSNILRKLDVLDRTQAAVYAIKNNLIN